MLSTKHAKHAKPSLHPTRSTLSVGLTAVLLPLCMASPALADTAPTTVPGSPGAGDPGTASPYVLPGWEDVPVTRVVPLPALSTPRAAAPAAPLAQPADAPSADTAPAPAAEIADPPAAAPAAPVAPPVSGVAPTAEPEAATPADASPVADEDQRLTTVLRMSGPGGTVAPGSHTVAVRLLAGGNPVKNGYVRLEKKTSSGWVYAGRLLTRGNGLGVGKLYFSASTRLRAVYAGAATRTPGESSDVVVSVKQPRASFRQVALRVASQQAGKPYRYGATGPSAFDCSGFVRYSFARAGKQLPRTSAQQRRATKPIPRSQAVPGDLVFMNARVGHVGIYAGNGKMWDAPSSGGHVSLRRIYSSSYSIGRVV